MRKAGEDELLFEISETEDDDINRKSTPCDSYKPVVPLSRPPAPHPDAVPFIDAESRRLAEELFAKQFPEGFQRVRASPNSSRGDGSSMVSKSGEHSPVAYPNVPRVHVTLSTKTCSPLYLPFRIGPDSSLDLPTDVATRHCRSGDKGSPKAGLSFEERSMQESRERRERRRKEWVGKLKKDMEECTFRPKVISSPKSRSPGVSSLLTSSSFKRANSSYSDRFIKRKSSLTHSQSPRISRSPSTCLSFTIAEKLRVPPPNPPSMDPPTLAATERKKKGGYAPLSPTNVKTSYREGCNWKQLKKKIISAKKM